jgi:cell division septation protein DedD
MRDTRFITIAAVLLLTIAAAVVLRSKKKTDATSERPTEIVTRPSSEVRDENGEPIRPSDPTPTTKYKPTSDKDLSDIYNTLGSEQNTTTKSAKDADKTIASTDEFTSKGGDVTTKKARPAVEIVDKPVVIKPKPVIKTSDLTEKEGFIERKRETPRNIPSAYNGEKYVIDGYLVTVGAFASNESVMRQIESLRVKGFDQANFGKFEFAPSLKVVYAGKFDNEASAKSLVKQLQKKGFKEAAVRKRL